LAIGLVAVALMDNMRLDLNAYLFGDLLAVSQSDLVIIGSVCSLIISLLVWRWNALLNITVHAELAAVEGFAVAKLRLLLMLLIALLVAVAMKVVGVLLITALLIIPAATARKLARSPEQMAVGAVVIGVVAVAGGLYLSMTADTPAGPSIVVIATALFALLSPWRKQA
jgi:zinc transport system permease protein